MNGPRILRIALLGLLLLTVLAGCSPRRPIATALDGVEVREYQGEQLSSVNDFRENSIRGPQDVPRETYRLAVTGLVDRPLDLTYDATLDRTRYSKVVTLHCVEGWDATILWEGVLIDDLLNEAGVKDGATTLLFHAADGYTSSLSLDYVRENRIILASKMNDVTLPAERGFPFQVVAEEKWGYKWVKWVTKIEVSDDPDFRGYWERAGYNNNGNFAGPKFER